jgi:hypothetical protein
MCDAARRAAFHHDTAVCRLFHQRDLGGISRLTSNAVHAEVTGKRSVGAASATSYATADAVRFRPGTVARSVNRSVNLVL